VNLPTDSIAWIAAGGGLLTDSAQVGNYTVVAGDLNKIISYAAGTFTVSLTAVATLGKMFRVGIFNNGAGVITIDPNGSELIVYNGGSDTTLVLAAGQKCILECNGVFWVLVVW
jgi:hypothetical protein